MPRSFDSGFALPMRTMMRHGVMNLLAPTLYDQSLNPNGYASGVIGFPFVMRYRGDDDFETDVLVELARNRAPGYAVATGDMKVGRGGAVGKNLGTLDVVIYSFNDHKRDLVEGRLEGDVEADQALSKDPGIDVMLEYAFQLVADRKVEAMGTKGKEIRFAEEHHVFTHKSITVWASSFTVEVERNVNQNPGVTQLITGLDAKHRFRGDIAPDPTADPLIETLSLIPAPPP